jgi:hypothetical protein
MSSYNFGQEKLNQYLDDVNNTVKGFSVENTENGFILSLIAYRDSSEGRIKLDPVFVFEQTIRYETVVDPIMAAMKLKAPWQIN